MNYKEFTDKILCRGNTTKHKISGSLGVYDCYKYLRRNKWFDLPRPIKEKEFYSIVRNCNLLLQEELLKGNAVILPYKLGIIEVLKTPTKVEFVDGKLKTNKRVDWKSTLKLWYEDDESKNKKTLIRFDRDSNIVIRYNRHTAVYSNVSFYSFKPNKQILLTLKKLFNEGLIDALQLNYEMEYFKYKR